MQRGATWKTSLHMCDGRTPTPEELPSCYEGSDWSGCTLQQFMDCPYNLANNRQVQANKSNTNMPEATIKGNKNSTLKASKDWMCCYCGSEASAIRKSRCTQISAIKCSFKDFFCKDSVFLQTFARTADSSPDSGFDHNLTNQHLTRLLV